MGAKQRTIAKRSACRGVGLHRGMEVTMTIDAAEGDSGIRFIRSDVPQGKGMIQALWSNVVESDWHTALSNSHGVSIATVEHLMAAFRGAEIDNALVEIDGEEVPIMDGSSGEFLSLMGETREQEGSRYGIRIVEAVEVRQGESWARLEPCVEEIVFKGTIDFPRAIIGYQEYCLKFSPRRFKDEIARARTFGFYEDVDWMRDKGLIKGCSLENAVVFKDDQVLTPGGLRYPDECVRHKILDSVGDLYLAGGPIFGSYHGYKAGHRLHYQLLDHLFHTPRAWRWEEG